MCTYIMIDIAVYKMESCVHSYHIYKGLWDASIREDIMCEREPFNDTD